MYVSDYRLLLEGKDAGKIIVKVTKVCAKKSNPEKQIEKKP